MKLHFEIVTSGGRERHIRATFNEIISLLQKMHITNINVIKRYKESADYRYCIGIEGNRITDYYIVDESDDDDLLFRAIL